MKCEQKQEIHLRDMIYKILSAWRLLAVLTVVLALVLGGGKFLLDTLRYCRNAEENQPQVVTREDLEKELTPLQLSTVKEAEVLRELVAQKEEYAKNSLYLAIDPYHQHTVTLLYYADAKSSLDFTNGIVTAKGEEVAKGYVAYINNTLFADDTHENAVYYREVVKAEALENSGYQFAVTVKGATKEAVTQLAEQVKPLVENAQGKMEQIFGSHSLKQINETYSVVVDRQVMEEKEQFLLNLNTLRKNLSTLENGFNSAQLELYRFGLEPIDQPEATPTPAKPSLRLKYVILGGILGLAFGVIWVALRYMTGSRLRKAEELTEIYGVDCLGVLPTKKRKRKFGFVDRIIDRFFTRKKWNKAQRIDFTVEHLQMMSEKHNAADLVLMTNLKLSKHEKGLVDEIIGRLQEAGITVTVGEQIHQNMDSYHRVRSCGKVVLLEKEGASFYTDIQQELVLCRRADIKVLGAVAFVQ